jgi:hypothetical protein
MADEVLISFQEALDALGHCTGVRLKINADSIAAVSSKIGDMAELNAALLSTDPTLPTTVVGALNKLLTAQPALDNTTVTDLARLAILDFIGASPTAWQSVQSLGEYLANAPNVEIAIVNALADKVDLVVDQMNSPTRKAMGRHNIEALGVAEGTTLINEAETRIEGKIGEVVTTAMAPTVGVVAGHTDLIDTLLSSYPPPGAMNAVVAKGAIPTYKSGRLALVTDAVYSPTAPAGTLVTWSTRTPVISTGLTDVDTPFRNADKGVVKMNHNGVAVGEVDIGSLFNPALKMGNQSYPPAVSATGNLVINSVGVHNTFHQRGILTGTIPATLRKTGHNEVSYQHTVGTTTSNSQSYKWWNDINGVLLGVTGVTCALAPNVTTTSVSGVKYLKAGDGLLLGSVATGVFANTYLDQPMTYSALNAFTANKEALNASTVSGVTSPVPVNTDSMSVSGKLVTVAGGIGVSNGITINVVGENAHEQVGASLSTQIMTWAPAGARSNTIEPFVGESHRLPTNFNMTAAVTSVAGLQGLWNSQTLLTPGEAQVGVRPDGIPGVIAPTGNFTSKLPANTANYSANSGPAVFKTFFVSPSAAGNFILKVSGVTSLPSKFGTGAWNVRVALPSQTNMLDGAEYEYSTQVATDLNAGSMYAPPTLAGGVATLYLNFKKKSTISSSGVVMVELTLNNTSASASSLTAIFGG